MKKKLLLQDFADLLAQNGHASKKEAESFVRAFFDVIEQGLTEDKFVKIKGLGTFKLVAVSERESVNINTGERFQISGHTKISFTPDNSMKDLVNRPFAHFEAVDLNEDTDMAELDQVDKDMELIMQEEEQEEADDNDLSTDNIKHTVPSTITTGMNEVGDAAETTEISEAEEEETEQSTASDEGTETAENQENLTQTDIAESIVQAETSDRVEPVVIPTETEAQATDGQPASPATEADHEQPEVTDGEDAESNLTDHETAHEGEQVPAETELPAESEPDDNSPDSAPTTTEKAEEDISVSQPRTITPNPTDYQATQADMLSPLNYTYCEPPKQRRWGWIRITLSVLLLLCLLIATYFAGYYRVLCPCSIPCLAPYLPPVEQEAVPQKDSAVQVKPPVATPAHPATKQDTPRPDSTAKPAQQTAPIKEAKSTENEPTTKNKVEKSSKQKEVASAEPSSAAQPAAKPTETPKADNDSVPKRPTTHKVKEGENLYKISRRYYGSDQYVPAIIRLNHLRNADNITVGSIIKLP
ncbi:MAG: HU family DNA-binding protein [Alloprevotella sp.]